MTVDDDISIYRRIDQKRPPWLSRVFAQPIVLTILGGVIGGLIALYTNLFLEKYRFERQWKTDYLTQFIAPATMYISRTKDIADRYRRNPTYAEAEILYESNKAMRELLLSKAHLIRSGLVPSFQCLLTHYDIWIKRYNLTLEDHVRNGKAPRGEERFDVGYSELENRNCGAYPKDINAKVVAEFKLLQDDLYGSDATGSRPSDR